MFFGTSILGLFLEDFRGAWGPQNWWFSHFFRIFYHANFEAFFWTAKNQVFEKRISILGPLGGSCGPGKLKLRAWLKRKSPSMLNPYVEGNVYPFVVYFFWLPLLLGLARRAPRWGRRSAAHVPPRYRRWQKASSNACSSFLQQFEQRLCTCQGTVQYMSRDCLQEPRAIHSKVD